jgi:hypothetical protein
MKFLETSAKTAHSVADSFITITTPAGSGGVDYLGMYISNGSWSTNPLYAAYTQNTTFNSVNTTPIPLSINVYGTTNVIGELTVLSLSGS